ncbi:MAG: hypothetical protein WBY94_08210, partial [Polyangiaceae bacterium]
MANLGRARVPGNKLYPSLLMLGVLGAAACSAQIGSPGGLSSGGSASGGPGAGGAAAASGGGGGNGGNAAGAGGGGNG